MVINLTSVLVTGGTGFIGKHLVKALVKEDYQVLVLARNPSKASDLEELGVKIVKGDVTKPNTLRNIKEDVETIIHLAALMRFHGVKWDDLYNVNVIGTENMIKLALRKDVNHFILTSTTEVIGPCEKIPADENASPNPTYDYGKSKLMAEKMALNYYREEGLPVTIIRPSGVYGPGDLYVTYSVIKAIAKGLMSRLPGGGSHYIQFVFVEDVVQGYLKVLRNRERAIGETYIITSEDYYTYWEAFSIIAEILGVKPPKGSMPIWLAKVLIWLVEKWNAIRGIDDFVFHVSVVNDMMTDRVYSIDKAKRELGYQPRYDFRRGMEITINWYKANGYL